MPTPKYTYTIYTGKDRASAMCMRVTVLLSYNVWLNTKDPLLFPRYCRASACSSRLLESELELPCTGAVEGTNLCHPH